MELTEEKLKVITESLELVRDDLDENLCKLIDVTEDGRTTLHHLELIQSKLEVIVKQVQEDPS